MTKRLSDTAALTAAGPGKIKSVSVDKIENGYMTRSYDDSYNCKEIFSETAPRISVEQAPGKAARSESLSGAKAALKRG